MQQQLDRTHTARTMAMRWTLTHGMVPLALILFSFCTFELQAGATASQWVVVVNAESRNSRTIANHFCELRSIPDRNVIVLNHVPSGETATIDDFREKILQPVLHEIENRGLLAHVQGIAYSADFPTAIDFHSDAKDFKESSQYLSPIGSINGLTYLFRLSNAKSPMMLNLEGNLYACREGKLQLEKGIPNSVQKEFELFVKNLEAGELAEAKTGLEKMIRACPKDYALTYLAARKWAKHADPESTIELLEIAINQGWCYRKYLAEDPEFESLRDKSSFQILRDSCPEVGFEHQRSRGFDARSYWTPSGIPSAQEKDGLSYLLSTVLAVTRGDGNTLEEAIAYLKKSKDADFSRPQGKFYFTKTSDVRSTTRQPGFAITQERLKQLQLESEVVTTDMPMIKDACLGVSMGTPKFNWKASLSYLAPGAIAENLTSFGGVMGTQGGQTKLSEYLRYGAAGSSGTVTEPYSIQAKFPHPMIQAHYADGATLAEAFYLSVTGPYQLLIVGDPLCQPFSRPPKVRVTGIQPHQRLGKKVELKLEVEDTTNESLPARIDFLLDGRAVRTIPFVSQVNFDIGDDISAGAHTLGLIFTDNSHMERKWEFQCPVRIGDVAMEVRCALAEKQSKRAHLRTIACKGPANTKIRLMHHWEMIGELDSNQGEIEINLTQLGSGPIRLHAIASNGQDEWSSRSIVVEGN